MSAMSGTNIGFSSYQQAIFHYVRHSRKPLIVTAVAGAGKTTTLIEIYHQLRGTKLFCAFNKHIVDELKKRMNISHIKTIHSIGLGTLGRVNINQKKYWQIIKDFLNQARIYGQRADKIRPWLKEIISLGQANLAVGSQILEVMDQLGKGNPLSNPDLLVAAYEYACYSSINLYEQYGIIDYIDMIWLPNRLNLLNKLSQYDAVLVDEIQDLSKAQLEIVIGSLRLGGQFIGVGDEYQSIYAFAGSDPYSIHRIKERLNAEVLPLSISYRCPKLHVALARRYNPSIRSCPTNSQGLIYSWDMKGYLDSAEMGDLIICRWTAPLVDIALNLLARQISCRIRGRDIGKNIRDIISNTAPNCWTLPSHIAAIHSRMCDEVADLDPEEDRETIAEIKDKYMCILALVSESKAKTLNEIYDLLDCLFSDSQIDTHTIWLSTIHRAKGLEADRVIFVNRSKMPPEMMITTPIERMQEENLIYVALTRSKKCLVFLETDNTPYIPSPDEYVFDDQDDYVEASASACSDPPAVASQILTPPPAFPPSNDLSPLYDDPPAPPPPNDSPRSQTNFDQIHPRVQTKSKKKNRSGRFIQLDLFNS